MPTSAQLAAQRAYANATQDVQEPEPEDRRWADDECDGLSPQDFEEMR